MKPPTHTHGPDRASLVREAAGRSDPEVWDELVRRFGSAVRAGVRSGLRAAGLRPGADAGGLQLEDFVQEAWCRLLADDGRRLRCCRATGAAGAAAYLKKVGRSAVLDLLRAAAAEKRGGDLTESLDGMEPETTGRGIDGGPTPEQRLLVRERRARFFRACRTAVGSGTPRRDLRILYLAVVEGWRSRDIARHCRVTAATVDSLVCRVKKRLRRQGVEIPRRRRARW